jgi:hypothetical protein
MERGRIFLSPILEKASVDKRRGKVYNNNSKNKGENRNENFK